MATESGDRVYLSIRGLSKRFGGFVALKSIDLEVYEGEFLCFLGPSGCGKTTLLRAIAGLDVQTSGTIRQAGRDISELPASERDFGIVFQSYALFPNLTVRRNVAYGLENGRRPREQIDARVRELLQLVGLPDQADKYPAQLSGGQQQRVALARALAMSPGLLLLDEPLSALDARVRARLRHEVRALQDRLGVTTVMVTHDQEEALTMADRIVVMNHGVIEQVGTPAEIYRKPRTAFVADFIGTMNFIDAVHDGGSRVRVGEVLLEAEQTALDPGSAVTIAIRPEDFVVIENGSVPGNLLPGHIRRLEFLGPFVRASLEVCGGVAIDADLSANLFRHLALAEGDPLSVSVPADRIRVFPRITRG